MDCLHSHWYSYSRRGCDRSSRPFSYRSTIRNETKDRQIKKGQGLPSWTDYLKKPISDIIANKVNFSSYSFSRANKDRVGIAKTRLPDRQINPLLG